MILRIGTTEIAITENPVRRRDTKRGFFLDITIPKDNIGMEELYNLLSTNETDIAVVNDDGTENVYKGFKEVGSFALENGNYHIAQVCTSEYEAQLSLMQNKVVEQNKIIEAQNEEIVMLNDTLLEVIMGY